MKISETKLKEMVKKTIKETLNNAKKYREITDKGEISCYADEIWDILEYSYQDLGGFQSYPDKEQMVERTSKASIIIENGEITTCAIYHSIYGGYKMVGCGTVDGTPEHKQDLREIIKEDIKNIEKYHWSEISYPLERLFKEEGGNPIPSKLAPSLLHKGVGQFQFLDDKVHYKRFIGISQTIATKCIYGFKDEKVFDKVVNNIENLTGFDTYEDFKNHVNKQPRILQEVEYQENHPDLETAYAIEMIIQFSGMYDEGQMREITENMFYFLKTAVNILKEKDQTDKQVSQYLKEGLYLMERYEILTSHEACVDTLYLPAF